MNRPGNNNLLSVMVNFSGNKLFATANIVLNDPSKNISFILNDLLIIEKIESKNSRVKWNKTDDVKLEFRAPSQKIVVSSENPIAELSVTYYGPIHYFYNVITEEIKALSSYSVWFPQELPLEKIKDEVIIENSDNMFVVKGTFDNGKKVWYYGGKGYDPFNIIIYKKDVLKTISNEYINIYYVDPGIEKYAAKTGKEYQDILRFYNGNLFERHELPVLDIACVSPALITGGGYRRKNLMYCTTLGENDVELSWLLAHETAHEWCNGADASSWEDWLNETTADWAALLYAVEKDDNELFRFIIDMRSKDIINYPPIKTNDGSRPDGVHEKGVILFYNLYEKYGKDVVRKMTREFTDMKIKNTESFIKMVEKEISKEVAEEIRVGIEK